VQITQAATQGNVTGGTALAASTTINSGNNTFSLSVDGQNTGNITLASGTYTPAQLAALVQSAINAQLSGPSVAVSVNGSNDLVINSKSYGAHSNVTVGSSGTALSALGLTASQTGSGQDVAGSFLYNGVSEAATGNGQYLTSNSSNKYTGGLEILSTLTPAQITGTPEGTLTFTQGVAAQLGNVLTRMLDPVNGQLTLATQALQSQSDNIGQAITKQQQSMQVQQQQLLAEFTNMESVLAQLQTAGNSLTNSLTSFTPTSGSSSGH
jgi:flagellar hook-associated protein 2